MAQSTTNLGKIHVFPSESLYNQFKDIIASNDLALLKDDGAYIVAALLEQNGYVKFSNGLILQWGTFEKCSVYVVYPIPFSAFASVVAAIDATDNEACQCRDVQLTKFLPWQKYSNSQGKWMAVGR